MLLVMTTFACDQKVVTCLCEIVIITGKKEKITNNRTRNVDIFYLYNQATLLHGVLDTYSKYKTEKTIHDAEHLGKR